MRQNNYPEINVKKLAKKSKSEIEKISNKYINHLEYLKEIKNSSLNKDEIIREINRIQNNIIKIESADLIRRKKAKEF